MAGAAVGARLPSTALKVVAALGLVAVLVGGAALVLGYGTRDAAIEAGAGTALPAPRFSEEALAAGVRHAYDGEFEFFVGGGVAAFDCDDDGLPDLYFAGGANPAALFRNRSPAAARWPSRPCRRRRRTSSRSPAPIRSTSMATA